MNEDTKLLFELVERCHTGLGNAFPHEGLEKIGGSRIFMRGNMLPILRECFDNILVELHKTAVGIEWLYLIQLRIEMGALLLRVEKRNQPKYEKEISLATRFLYLANGLTWHRMCQIVDQIPPHNPQYDRVEPILPLLLRCGWKGETVNNGDPKILVKELASDLRKCLNAP